MQTPTPLKTKEDSNQASSAPSLNKTTTSDSHPDAESAGPQAYSSTTKPAAASTRAPLATISTNIPKPTRDSAQSAQARASDGEAWTVTTRNRSKGKQTSTVRDSERKKGQHSKQHCPSKDTKDANKAKDGTQGESSKVKTVIVPGTSRRGKGKKGKENNTAAKKA